MALGPLTDLRKTYRQQITTARTRGVALVRYQAPCCGGTIRMVAVPEEAVRDSFHTCVYCGSLYQRIATHTTVNTK